MLRVSHKHTTMWCENKTPTIDAITDQIVCFYVTFANNEVHNINEGEVNEEY